MLNQVEREHKYDKRRVVRKIIESLDDSTQYRDDFDKVMVEVNKLLSSPPELSKEMFDDYKFSNDPENLVADIYAAVLVAKTTTFISVVGQCFKKINDLTEEGKISVTADILGLVLVHSNLLLANFSKSGKALFIHSMLVPDKETAELLEQTQYMPPMVERPKMVLTNFDIGYHDTKCSLVLNSFHNKYQNYTAVNIANGTKLVIDRNMIGEVPEIDPELDDKGKINEARFNETTLSVIKELNEYPHFYELHSMDFRGRMYTKGYHLHTQGDDYRRAMINLKEEYYL